MDGRLLPIATVTCVRCKSAISEREADYCADGMICPSCALDVEVAGRLGIDKVGGDTIALAARAFTRSTAIKHLIIGAVGLVAGVVLLVIMGWIVSHGVISARSSCRS